MPTLNEEDEEERDGFLAARRPLDREGALLLEEDLHQGLHREEGLRRIIEIINQKPEVTSPIPLLLS